MEENPPATLLAVQQTAFTGPVELLLQLAQRQELDVATIELHQLTQAYLATLQAMPKPDPERVGAFLVVAAKLIQLKAARLLPSLHPPEAEDLGDWEAAMRDRLVEYRKFKELAGELMRQHAAGQFTFASLLQPEIVPQEALQIDLGALAAAFEEILGRLPAVDAVEMTLESFNIEEKQAAIRQLLALHTEINFAQVFATAQSRLEAVVIFLALLELIRLAEAEVLQPQPFGPIRVKRRTPPVTPEQGGAA
jgi:segregation and condensation protein A